MGFDLSGERAKNKAGEYFRNNVWWWRPLWNYVRERELITDAQHTKGMFNDGLLIGDAQANEIATKLKIEIKSGRTKRYATKRHKLLDALPEIECDLCKGTGKRTWIENNKPVIRICNGCDGKGTRKQWDTHYSFNVKNVQEFVEFCENSGGFRIY
jgi:hypothetical protein